MYVRDGMGDFWTSVRNFFVPATPLLETQAALLRDAAAETAGNLVAVGQQAVEEQKQEIDDRVREAAGASAGAAATKVVVIGGLVILGLVLYLRK